MNKPEGKPLVLGTVKGFRGPRGEVTITVVSGDAARWVHLSRVMLTGGSPGSVSGVRNVESCRAYRDRLVVKLAGIDDANRASELRGCEVAALAEELPELPDGAYWAQRLVGAQVMDRDLGHIGRVLDVVETGGVDVLLVKDDAGSETLVPLADRYIASVDESAGLIRVALAPELRDVNDDDARGLA